MSALKEALALQRSLPKDDDEINIPLYSEDDIDPNIISLWDTVGIDHKAPYLNNREVHLSTHTIDHEYFRIDLGKLENVLIGIAISLTISDLVIIAFSGIYSMVAHDPSILIKSFIKFVFPSFFIYGLMIIIGYQSMTSKTLYRYFDRKKTNTILKKHRIDPKDYSVKEGFLRLKDIEYFPAHEHSREDTYGTLIYTMSLVIDRMWKSPIWSSSSYTGAFQREDLKSILSGFTKRALRAREVQSALNQEKADMSHDQIKEHQNRIDEAIESLAEEVVDLSNQLEKIKNAEKVFQQFDASAKSEMLKYRIDDALTQNNIETSALKSRLSESVEDIALTQKLIEKIDS